MVVQAAARNWTRARSARALALRARIELACADGVTNQAVAERERSAGPSSWSFPTWAEESGGNPLGLVELAAAFSAAERSGMPDAAQQIGPLPVTGRVQDAFRSQIPGLPDATHLLLVVAAADGTADIDAILGLAGSLGVSAADLEPSERVNLVALSDDPRCAVRNDRGTVGEDGRSCKVESPCRQPSDPPVLTRGG